MNIGATIGRRMTLALGLMAVALLFTSPTAMAMPVLRSGSSSLGHARLSIRHHSGGLQRLALSEINSGRAKHGLPALQLSYRQSKCSKAHSRAMANAGYLFHALPQDLCVRFSAAGENIGEWIGPEAAAVRAMNAVMWSEGPCPVACPVGSKLWEEHGHYLNFIDPRFTHVGVGVLQSQGEVWLTEDFTN